MANILSKSKSVRKQWKPTDKQLEGTRILVDPAAVRILFDGGARSGKTMLVARWMCNRAFIFPGSKQFGGRFTRKDIPTSCWLTFKEYLRDYVPPEYYHFRNRDLQIVFANGSFIHFDGLDTKERVDFILGTEWLTMFLNECTQNTYDTVTTMMTRLSQRVTHMDHPDVFGVPKLVMDCNPKHTRHWVYLSAIRNPPIHPTDETTIPPEGRWVRLNWSVYDNLTNLPATYLDVLNALPEVKRARMRDGIWKDNEGAVYDEFDEDVHVIDRFTIPSGWRRYRAIDFGFRNPFACIWFATDEDGRLYIYDEHYRSGMIVSDHAEIIKEVSMGERFKWTVADWDAEDRATLHRCGIKTVNAAKTNLRKPGIDAVKERLKVQGDGRPRLFVLRHCVNTISEFYDYAWPTADSAARGKSEDPVDKYNHAMDALRYAVYKLDVSARGSKLGGGRSEQQLNELISGF
ncbi:MAG: phage terminase large subunit [Pseudomonadota bacterium]